MERNVIVCSSCSREKPADSEHFPSEDGRLRKQCKLCRSEQKRLARIENETPERRERRLFKAREYSRIHVERLSKIAARRYAENKDRVSEYDRARYHRIKDEVKARSRAWREENKERKLANNRKWAEENPEKAAASALASKRKRRKDPKVKLSDAISSNIRISLMKNKNGRSWQDLVGYSVDELRSHLERQFVRGMSWENYGKWHVDHILPIASFSFDAPTDPDFRACWSLTNLRPLWATDNIIKRDKRLVLL